jgi:hypothetical protein
VLTGWLPELRFSHGDGPRPVSHSDKYLLALRDYSLKDHAGKITCPTFVCDAEGDDISVGFPAR